MGGQQLGFLAGSAATLDRPIVGPESLGLANRITYAATNTLLTPTSGFMAAYKFSLNPYSGCGFGCDYCYARFFAPTEEARDSWGQWVRVKTNAVEMIQRAARSKSEKSGIGQGDAIYLSTVTDPYQPIEKHTQLTREILRALIPLKVRLTVQTRSPIATRDIDLFQELLAAGGRLRVNFTVSTDCEAVRLRYESHCPAIEVRLKAAEEISKGGVPIGISVSPMLPIADPETFGARIAALNAAEYVTQAFKDPRNRFAAGTTVHAMKLAAEDGWGRPQYEQVRDVLQRHLGSERILLEGACGYAPA